MDFVGNVVQTNAPHFVELGIPAFNTLEKLGIIGTPTTIIIRPTYVSHWSAPDPVFGEATAVGIIVARQYQYNSYNNLFLN